MKYKLLLLLCFFTVAFLTETEASARKKKKETAKTPVKKESAYDKLFKKDHTQAKGLINLHRVDNKLYFELPLQLLGKDMLLGSTVTEISDNGDAIVGQKPKEPLHIQFTMIDSTIQLRQIFNYSITRPEDKNITRLKPTTRTVRRWSSISPNCSWVITKTSNRSMITVPILTGDIWSEAAASSKTNLSSGKSRHSRIMFS